jgi:hypothetical protein
MKKIKLYVLALIVLLIIFIFLFFKVKSIKKNRIVDIKKLIITEYNSNSDEYDKAYVVIKDNKVILHYSAKESSEYGEDTIINVKNINDSYVKKIKKLVSKGRNSISTSGYSVEYNNKRLYIDSKDDKDKIIQLLFEK